ncbi:I78 family peptidase inhibitor [uncultured Paracoccus sp.]|uniref:I78 family peptidase inhibitor n=1 Tax=uncultured Paracoccus sp. TaxID=189685 RepID=UPI00263922A6|nr:I78 family peptidase inhibitor [uncultured Paracoccus sp.]
MTRLLLIGLGPLALAACDPAAPAGPLDCDDSYQSLIGQNIGAVTLPAGLSHRIISPGMAVTEDYNPDRLNVYVDDKGWIARTECW